MICLGIDEFAEQLSMLSFKIDQTVINTILRFGSNTTNARYKLLNLFAIGCTDDEIAKCLPVIFHGGYGVDIWAQHYAAWYGENGIRIAMGDAAKNILTSHIVTYKDAASYIRSMIECGTFATSIQIDDSLYMERQELAKDVWYMVRDIDAGYSDMIHITKEYQGGGFPDETDRLKRLLSDPEKLAQLIDDMRNFTQMYHSDRTIMRFQYHKPDTLLHRLEALAKDHKYCNSTIDHFNEQKSFITEDEIDASLACGSSVSGGKIRIYSFFAQQQNESKRVEFLKHEYGIGGRSHAVSGADHSGEDHDAHGIKLHKLNCSEVDLPYTKVAQRIQRMIDNEEYLNADEMIEYESKGYTPIEIDDFIEQYT